MFLFLLLINLILVSSKELDDIQSSKKYIRSRNIDLTDVSVNKQFYPFYTLVFIMLSFYTYTLCKCIYKHYNKRKEYINHKKKDTNKYENPLHHKNYLKIHPPICTEV